MTTGDIEAELYGLRRAHPGWLILFGAYTRRYVAHGYLLDRPGIWVTAGTPAELHRRMELMETYPLHRNGHSPPQAMPAHSQRVTPAEGF